MRQPYETLVIPYKKENNEYKFAIFLRSDKNFWQGICGGGEAGETILETAKREAYEEAGLSYESEYMQLETMTMIPVISITGEFTWGEDVLLVKEYCFGVDATNQEIKLSNEHQKYRWFSYEEAKKFLKWDSDKTALWELNEKLKRNIKNKELK